MNKDTRGSRSFTLVRLVSSAAKLGVLVFAITLAPRCLQAQTYSVIYNFAGGLDGGNPVAGVAVDRAGNLYGTTLNGGNGHGTVYRLSNVGGTWIKKTLYAFAGSPDGARPRGPLTIAPDGTLYGSTAEGGQGGCSNVGCGTVFKLRPPTTTAVAPFPWKETIIYRFGEIPDGNAPWGFLTFDQSGSIYGTTFQGGSANGGVVYKLARSGVSWTETILWSFSGGSDGAFPHDGVTFDGAGDLYGTVLAGGSGGFGEAFELTPTNLGWNKTELYSFLDLDDGGAPVGSVILDNSGNVYGSTVQAGSGQGGTVFELNKSEGWSLSVLTSFFHTGGGNCGPQAILLMDHVGNLYGITFCDGTQGSGSVFKLTSGTWAYTSLHDFGGYPDGLSPISSLVLDGNGNLFGTTSAGGTNNQGTIFEITP